MHPHPDIVRMRAHEYSPLGRSTVDSENGIHQVHHERTGPVPIPQPGADPSYSSNDTTPKREDKPPLLISTNHPPILSSNDDHPLSATSSNHPLYPSSLDTADSDHSHTLASPNLLNSGQDEDEHSALTSQSLNHDGTPKRPMNAFMIFARRRRPQVSAANQSMRTGEISKILSREWSTMQMRDKQFYLDQAKKLKDNFSSRYPDYVYKRRPNNSRKRRRANSLDSMNPGIRAGDDNDSGEGDLSPGHDSNSSIHSRGLGSPDQLISPVSHISDINAYPWPNRSVHPHPSIGPPHDPILDLQPGQGHPHAMGLAYPERYNQIAWPPLSPLGSKPPSHHPLHHRASWGGVPSLAPISAEDPRPEEITIESSTSWGSAGAHPAIPKLETIKLETSTTPPGTTADGWYVPIGTESGNGAFQHHPHSAGLNRPDVYTLPASMTARPWSASGSSAESDTNTHSGSIHSSHQPFDPAMVAGGPGPVPAAEYYPSPSSAHSSLYFPTSIHPGASATSIGSTGAHGTPGPEGSLECPPHAFEDEHPYAHPHTHTHTPPPSFGSAAYMAQTRTPSAYDIMGPRHAIRRDSTGLEPPFGMH